MPDVLRGAVIGAGYFSQYHFDAWQRLDGVDIVACCDSDITKAQARAKQYGITGGAYADYRQMLDQHAVDFVDLVTRPENHLEIGTDLVGRGLVVICQKPLAPTLEHGRQLIELAAAAGTRLMVHENFRFQPWYREIKQLLDRGAIGSRLHTISHRNRMGDGWGSDAYLARQPYFQTMQRFLLVEAGIHTVDTYRFLAGEIQRVWCCLRKLNPVIAGEDAGLAIFEFSQGGVGLYDANRYNESTAENPRYTFGEMLVEADEGSIRLYDDGKLTIQRLGEQEVVHPYDPARHGFAGDCVYATQRHFVSCLESGEAFETDGLDYLRSIAVQEAMYRSARTGHWELPNAFA